MSDDTTITPLRQPGTILDPLTKIAREGARQMLAAALKAEAASFVAQFSDELLPDGRQRVVRHGTGPERAFRPRQDLVPPLRQAMNGNIFLPTDHFEAFPSKQPLHHRKLPFR